MASGDPGLERRSDDPTGVRAGEAAEVRPEQLAARYADEWVIYRDLCRDGTHDEWVAESRKPANGGSAKITADDIEGLAERLAAAGA